MTSSGFAYPHLIGKSVPAPAPRWAGNAKFNFIGGHNDRALVPIEGLIAATASVLRRDGADLALYSLAQGPQGYRGLRQFVADKVTRWRGIAASPDDVLITSGSGQAIDLINQVLLEAGDTVILEEFTYGGYLTKLRRLGVNIVGAPLDEDGIRVDALAAILADLKRRGITPKYICTVPTIQNPTGSIMPLARRHEFLALAREYGVPIFEDECYADLTWGGMDGAAGALFIGPRSRHPYRLVLEDPGAGAAARLRRRRLGVHEPHGRDQDGGRQRHRRPRADGRRRVFLTAFRGPCRRAERHLEGEARHRWSRRWSASSAPPSSRGCQRAASFCG